MFLHVLPANDQELLDQAKDLFVGRHVLTAEASFTASFPQEQELGELLLPLLTNALADFLLLQLIVELLGVLPGVIVFTP